MNKENSEKVENTNRENSVVNDTLKNSKWNILSQKDPYEYGIEMGIKFSILLINEMDNEILVHPQDIVNRLKQSLKEG